MGRKREGDTIHPQFPSDASGYLPWAVEEEPVPVNPCLMPSKIFKVDPFHGDFLRRVQDLRGTYTSTGVSAGIPIYHVSKNLGHADTTTTERYYALPSPGPLREIPEKLERFVFGKSATQAQPEEVSRMLAELTPRGNA